MKKTYLSPTTNGLTIEAQCELLANSFDDNKINVDTSKMEGGDGSDGVKADRSWADIWE